ncbi:MAG TPA: adenylate/guanylate cyclase domain-containing protein, partial [Candidatus Binataceae bacterium]
RCAIAIQDALRSQTDGLHLRIGVHQGEVVPEGGDLFGDGVIIAARLEPLAEPGGICISSRVREDASGKIALEVVDIGEPALRNVVTKIRVFRVRLGAAERPALPLPNKPAFAVRADVASIANSEERSLIRGTRETLPLPDKPSIAVLAFGNLSGDPNQEYFSDGVADDIITELSRNRSLFVIARASSFTYKNQSLDVKQIARELGVRYIIDGSVRRDGNRVRISAQLIDAEMGGHIWAERFDRAVKDVFAVQDEITTAVITAIHPIVADAEQLRAMRKQPENLNAWEAYQRGLWHVGKFDAAENEQAKGFFQRAIALDGAFVSAYSALAMAYFFEGSQFATRPLDEAIKAAGLWAHKAVAIDPADADAQAVLAIAANWAGHGEAAWERAEQTLARNQNSPWAIGIMAGIPLNNGDPGKARDLLLTAMRRSPRDPHNSNFLRWVAMSYYFERDYTRAAEAAKRATALYPDNPMSYRWLAASLGQLGQTDEAREALRRAVDGSPRAFDVYVRNRPPWFRPEDHELMLDGLRKAGWED